MLKDLNILDTRQIEIFLSNKHIKEFLRKYALRPNSFSINFKKDNSLSLKVYSNLNSLKELQETYPFLWEQTKEYHPYIKTPSSTETDCVLGVAIKLDYLGNFFNAMYINFKEQFFPFSCDVEGFFRQGLTFSSTGQKRAYFYYNNITDNLEERFSKIFNFSFKNEKMYEYAITLNNKNEKKIIPLSNKILTNNIDIFKRVSYIEQQFNIKNNFSGKYLDETISVYYMSQLSNLIK